MSFIRQLSVSVGTLLFFFCFTLLISPPTQPSEILTSVSHQLVIHASNESVSSFTQRVLDNCAFGEFDEETCERLANNTLSLEGFLSESLSSQLNVADINTNWTSTVGMLIGMLFGLLLMYIGMTSWSQLFYKLSRTLLGLLVFTFILSLLLFFYVEFVVVDTSIVFSESQAISLTSLLLIVPFILKDIFINTSLWFFAITIIFIIIFEVLYRILSLAKTNESTKF